MQSQPLGRASTGGEPCGLGAIGLRSQLRLSSRRPRLVLENRACFDAEDLAAVMVVELVVPSLGAGFRVRWENLEELELEVVSASTAPMFAWFPFQTS